MPGVPVVPGPPSKAPSAATGSQRHFEAVQVVPDEPAITHHSWYNPGKSDIFFLGITIVMCGQYMSWNIGLVAGVYTYLIIYVVMGLAYITFCCCMAELTSALPFAGGSYGLARCTLGFFPAFLIGCAEALEYTMSVAIQAICVSDIIVQAAPALGQYRPLLWLVFYVPTVAVQCVGGAAFWIASTSLGAFQLVLLLVYCFGLLGDVSFRGNALAHSEMLFAGRLDKALYVFPFSAWFFLGVEALNLASNDVKHPKTQIPHGQVASICTLFVTGLFMYIVTVSLPMEGGVVGISGELGPLDNGFMRLFSIAPQYVTLLSLVPQYAGGYGFCWASSKLISSMARSKLLPPFFGETSVRHGTPIWAILLTAVVGYIVCLIVQASPSTARYILPLCLLFAFFSYSGQCVGYIVLRLRYPITSQCTYRNPFGMVGAVYSLLVWVLGILAIVGFQGHHGTEVIIFAFIAMVVGLYYRLVAKKRQVMSEEESRVLMVAHIAFFNIRKRSSRNTARSSASSGMNGPLLRTHTTRSAGAVESFHVSQSN